MSDWASTLRATLGAVLTYVSGAVAYYSGGIVVVGIVTGVMAAIGVGFALYAAGKSKGRKGPK